MDVINLSIRSIQLPSDKNLKDTSYEVATTALFKDDDIVFSSENDEDNKYDIDVEVDFTENDIYYARVKLHFDDDTYYGWTKPIVLTKDGDGFSHNNTIIITPKVTVTGDPHNCQLGGFRIKGGEFVIFSGSGYHARTTWTIKDNFGEPVWEIKRDEHNLTEIRVPSNILKPNRIYTVEVTYISNNNMMSNAGKLIIKTTGDAGNLEELRFGGLRDLYGKNKDLEETLEFVLEELINIRALEDDEY